MLTHFRPMFHPFTDKPGSWFLQAKCLKNTCGRVKILSKDFGHRHFASKCQLPAFHISETKWVDGLGLRNSFHRVGCFTFFFSALSGVNSANCFQLLKVTLYYIWLYSKIVQKLPAKSCEVVMETNFSITDKAFFFLFCFFQSNCINS